jgi:IS30 family transposase
VGHLDGDTVIGSGDKHCILTLVDRKTGYVMIGKLAARTVEATNQRAISLLRKASRHTRTLTLDNGTEFHGHKTIEKSSGVNVFFATPHHSWERGTSENTNGLIRQYLPQAYQHGSPYSEGLYLHCRTPQQSTQKTTRIPHPRTML